MRNVFIGALALLVAASFANGATLRAPQGLDTGLPGPGKVITISLESTSNEQVQGSGTYVSFPAFLGLATGGITEVEGKGGTVFAASTAAPTITLADIDGGGAVEAVGIDMGMQPFGTFAAPTGAVAFITIDTSPLAFGTYDILLAIPEFEIVSEVNGAAVTGTTLVSGTFAVTPEPASLMLLGLGGLFLRRRTA